MKKPTLIIGLTLAAVLAGIISIRPQKAPTPTPATNPANQIETGARSVSPANQLFSKLDQSRTKARIDEKPKRKASGEVVRRDLRRQMCETGLHPDGTPISPKRLAEMRANEARWEADAKAMAEWKAQSEADYQDSLTSVQRDIDVEWKAMHTTRSDIESAIRSRAGERLLRLAKVDPTIRGELPDDGSTTDEKLLLAALDYDRLEDPEAAGVIRDHLMREKAARIEELETGMTSDPQWAADNLKWIDQTADTLKLDLDPENDQWVAEFTDYHRELNKRWENEQPQISPELLKEIQSWPQEFIDEIPDWFLDFTSVLNDHPSFRPSLFSTIPLFDHPSFKPKHN